MATYRILSLDGGGVRGLLTGVLLQRLEQEVPGWLKQVDLIAGVSSGGIFALCLANGMPAAEVSNILETTLPDVLPHNWAQKIWGLGGLLHAPYQDTNSPTILRRVFGSTKLADLNKRVLIPAFDLDNRSRNPQKRRWAPRFFHNFPGPGSDGRRLAYKIGLYTSAAPSFFPAVDGYIDGGIFMANPSMAALTKTQEKNPLAKPPPLDNIALFSIGTGWTQTRISGNKLTWGKVQWRNFILQMSLDGSSSSVHHQCCQLLGKNYLRISPSFSDGEMPVLDNLDKIPALIQRAESMDLSKTIKWLRRVWVV